MTEAPDVGDLAALGALRLALRHLGREVAREEWSARPRELVDPERRHPGRQGLYDDGELPDLRPPAALLQPIDLDADGGQVDPSGARRAAVSTSRTGGTASARPRRLNPAAREI